MDFQYLVNSFINIVNEMSPYILLGFIIAGVLHVFVNEKTLTRHLSGHGLLPVIKAAAIGVPLPLCSCGVLPTAVSLRRQGASKAATTSFLIATPQTGVDSIAATYSLLGLAFALIRPIAALIGAIFGGLVVDRIDKDSASQPQSPSSEKESASDFRARPFHWKIYDSVKYGFCDMIDSIGKWLVIGLVIATLITVFVPDSFFAGFRQYPLVAMVVVVLVAIPMYICATGSIPIALSLMLKGLTPGVAFVLLMAGPAANFASIVILNRTMGKKATACYVASVVVTAIAFGVLIDYVFPEQWFIPRGLSVENCQHMHLGWFDTSCSILLGILLIASLIRTKLRNKYFQQKLSSINMKKEYTISGMDCNHCRAAVQKAISEVEGVQSVEVSLADKKAIVEGTASPEKIAEAVHNAGYEVVE